MTKDRNRHTSRWYVVRTMPPGERKAAFELCRAGFGAYLPERKVETMDRRQRVWRMRDELLFPGYVFVEFPEGGTWPALRGCDGVLCVVGYVDHEGVSIPLTIPSHLVERLMADQLAMRYDDTREARRRNGVDALADRRAQMIGNRVVVKDGPFAQHFAQIDEVPSLERVRAVLEMFGRPTVVELRADQVEMASA